MEKYNSKRRAKQKTANKMPTYRIESFLSPSLKMENFRGMYADNMALIFCPETSLRKLLARLTD